MAGLWGSWLNLTINIDRRRDRCIDYDVEEKFKGNSNSRQLFFYA